MGKNSTSSTKSKAKRSISTSSKGNKIYCSKVVGTILDNLIADEISKVKKHPNTVSKWMAKMRSSILKKISASTPFLFKSGRHDLVALDAQLSSNLKNIEATQAKIVASSRKMWQNNFDTMQKQAKKDASKRHHGGKNMENIFSEKVTKLNDNIDQMASQLSSLGKDIESRAMSLHNNIQLAEKLWASNPMKEQRMNTSAMVKRSDVEEQHYVDPPAEGSTTSEEISGLNDKNRIYRDLDVHLNEY